MSEVVGKTESKENGRSQEGTATGQEREGEKEREEREERGKVREDDT